MANGKLDKDNVIRVNFGDDHDQARVDANELKDVIDIVHGLASNIISSLSQLEGSNPQDKATRKSIILDLIITADELGEAVELVSNHEFPLGDE